MENIDFAALVSLMEEYWSTFVEYSGGEGSAEKTLEACRKEAGME